MHKQTGFVVHDNMYISKNHGLVFLVSDDSDWLIYIELFILI